MVSGHFDPAWKKRVHNLRDQRIKAVADELESQHKIFLNAMKHMAEQTSGQIVFRAMMNMLDFKGPTCVRVDGVLDTQSMLWNECRRNVWAELREYIPVHLRNEIEKDPESGVSVDPEI